MRLRRRGRQRDEEVIVGLFLFAVPGVTILATSGYGSSFGIQMSLDTAGHMTNLKKFAIPHFAMLEAGCVRGEFLLRSKGKTLLDHAGRLVQIKNIEGDPVGCLDGKLVFFSNAGLMMWTPKTLESFPVQFGTEVSYVAGSAGKVIVITEPRQYQSSVWTKTDNASLRYLGAVSGRFEKEVRISPSRSFLEFFDGDSNDHESIVLADWNVGWLRTIYRFGYGRGICSNPTKPRSALFTRSRNDKYDEICQIDEKGDVRKVATFDPGVDLVGQISSDSVLAVFTPRHGPSDLWKLNLKTRKFEVFGDEIDEPLSGDVVLN